MTELSRNLLAAAREGLEPDAAVAARVRAKVAASVAGTTAAATVAAPAKAYAALIGKLVVGAIAVGVVVATVVIVTRASPSAWDGASVESPRFTAAPVDLDEPRGTVRVATTEPAPAGVAPTPPHAAAIRPPAAAPREQPRSRTSEPITLSREVELIDRAMLLVRKDEASGALSVIAIYDRETHGDGQLAEDAAAIDIEARCRLRQDVTARLAAFDRAWPSSAQRSRLHTACFAK